MCKKSPRFKMPKLYLDTNIVIYASEESFNLFGKDLSVSSAKLLYQTVLCKHYVVISTWLLKELSNLNKLEQARLLFKIITSKTEMISYSKDDLERAKQRNPQHFQDELHGILALKAQADYIVTRNINDFKKFENQIKIVRPEDLL